VTQAIKSDHRSRGRRDALGDGGAPLVQHGFAQPFGVALASLRMLDDFARNDIVGQVAAIDKPKGYQCHFVCKTHEADRMQDP